MLKDLNVRNNPLWILAKARLESPELSTEEEEEEELNKANPTGNRES